MNFELGLSWAINFFILKEHNENQTEETTTVNPKSDDVLKTLGVSKKVRGVKSVSGHVSLSTHWSEFGENDTFEHYTPGKRTWLVIIEVNQTDESLNTECTGDVLILTDLF